MSWHTLKVDDVTTMIMADNRVVGSIVTSDDRRRVEILWSGVGGDISFECRDELSALAFVSGVEEAFKRC
jgi:hypothetical protein